MITNVFACLHFSIFQGVVTLLQSIVIEDESSFQVQPTADSPPPEPFVLFYIFLATSVIIRLSPFLPLLCRERWDSCSEKKIILSSGIY